MTNAPIFDRTVQLVQDRLNLISLSQRTVSSNVANIDTPRYVAKEVTFQGALDQEQLQLTTDNATHITSGKSPAGLIHADIKETGPVDLDKEMMKLSKNSVEYQFMVTMLNKKLAMLKYAVSEGAN